MPTLLTLRTNNTSTTTDYMRGTACESTRAAGGSAQGGGMTEIDYYAAR